MAEITLRQLGHAYGETPQDRSDYALKPADLVWRDGRTYALLGPSGCGKTTMLNIISGLIRPSTGQLLFDGRDMTHASTIERNIAQVFQFPVIYTTKTVRQNLAFPLECRKWDRARIASRVAHIADLLELSDILDMPARRLSADQKQIISLGRGLVRDDVSAVLLDEPLTVIDPQMKFGLRRKLREINRSTGVTMILVTHDQSEAMSFADEVVVMNSGEVQQAGPPEQLFARPANTFVGYFIGSPPLNLFSAELRDGRVGAASLGISVPVPVSAPASVPVGGGTIDQIGLRPEHIRILPGGGGPQARIGKVENLGVDAVYSLRSAAGEDFKVKSRHLRGLLPGDTVGLGIRTTDLLMFAGGRLVASGAGEAAPHPTA